MTETSSAKEQAIAEIVRIVRANDLDAADLRRVLDIVRPADAAVVAGPRAALGRLVLRVFYYLGGTLVFAGLGIYIQTVWQDLTSLERVLITLGPGVVAYLLGTIFARNPDLEKAATPAHIIGFLMQPAGAFVLLDEFFGGDDTALGAMVVFGPLAVQQLFTFLALRRASLLLFTVLFSCGFAAAATAYFDLDFGISALACGLLLFLVSVDLQRKRTYGELTPLFSVMGSGLILAGLSYHVGGTIYEPVLLASSLGFLMYAVSSGSRTLYVFSVVYVAGYFLDGLGGSFGGWSGHLRHHHQWTAMFTGTSLALAGHWLSRSPLISASPLWMFVGTVFALGGAYGLSYDLSVSPVFAALATLVIYAALALRSRAMLAAGILGLLAFLVDFAQRHFADSVSWPLLLIAFGLILSAAGFVFARLSGRIRDSTERAPESGVP